MWLMYMIIMMKVLIEIWKQKQIDQTKVGTSDWTNSKKLMQQAA